MAVIKWIVIALTSLAALLVVVGLLLPDTARVERSIVIDAPQATVFGVVNGFRNFNQWSPWHELDPDASYTLEGPAVGIGAGMSWASDDKNVGSGRQTIVGSKPYRIVNTTLDFGDMGTAEAYFRLQPVSGGTRVFWGFGSELGYDLFSRWFFALMADKMIGGDYEKGLAELKSFTEGLPDTDFGEADIEVVEIEPLLIAYASGTSSPDHEAIGAALAAAYGRVMRFLEGNRLEPAGQPLAITSSWNAEGWSFDAGIPITAPPATPPRDGAPVRIGRTDAGMVVKAVHTGPYGDLAATHEMVGAFIEAHGLVPRGRSWEQFVSDPGETPEEELITHIFQPVE